MRRVPERRGRLDRRRRLIRRRAAFPVLRIHASGRGRVAVRWSSGGVRGRRVLHVLAPGTRRVLIAGVPPRWPHAIRVTASLQPAGRAGPGVTARGVYPRS